MLKTLNRFLQQYNIKVSEEMLSMILGALVVIVIGIVAYNYFRGGQTVPVVSPVSEEQKEATPEGQLESGQAAVALPTQHTVVAGEHLWGIAEKYYRSGYNFVDIASVNSITNPNFLEVGQKLTIPKVEPRQPLTVSGAVLPTVTDSQIIGDSYTTIKGDYLWEIAIRAYGDGFKWVEIAKVNNLVNPNLIFSDQKLIIPR